MIRLLCSIVLVVAAAGLSGCAKPQEAPAPSESSPVRQIDAASLPGLGEYSPPLDGGRIEIAGPEGWELAPRLKDYVALFRGPTGDKYPLILVKGEDSSTAPLTDETVVSFASALAADGSAQPVAIGNRLGTLQRKRAKAPGSVDQVLERLIFTTVMGERTYSVELRTRQGQLDESQDLLLAVVAGMREIDAAPAEGTEDVAVEGTEEEKTKAEGAQKELNEMFN